MTPREFLSHLDKVVPVHGGWTARCLSHVDRKNSLSVGEGQDGRVLVKCFAQCAQEAIVNALGLDMSDLFADPPKSGNQHGKPLGDIVATYDFVDVIAPSYSLAEAFPAAGPERLAAA